MRVMALDVGLRWIGVAVTDETGTLAMPHSVLERQREGHRRDVARVRELARGLGVERIVVGLPLNMDGSEGRSAELARAFAEALRVAVSIPLEMHDERLSTFSAREAALEADPAGVARGRRVDDLAAAFLLRDYLERRTAGAAGQP